MNGTPHSVILTLRCTVHHAYPHAINQHVRRSGLRAENCDDHHISLVQITCLKQSPRQAGRPARPPSIIGSSSRSFTNPSKPLLILCRCGPEYKPVLTPAISATSNPRAAIASKAARSAAATPARTASPARLARLRLGRWPRLRLGLGRPRLRLACAAWESVHCLLHFFVILLSGLRSKSAQGISI